MRMVATGAFRFNLGVLIRWLLVAAALWCMLCTGVAMTQRGTAFAQRLGILKGTVTRGPLAPVGRPGIRNSTPVAAARIEITTSTGETVATIQSNSDGTYSVQLVPGTYFVRVIWPTTPFGNKPPQTIIIGKGEITQLDIRVDTGIR
jgi:hypothetical protein